MCIVCGRATAHETSRSKSLRLLLEHTAFAGEHVTEYKTPSKGTGPLFKTLVPCDHLVMRLHQQGDEGGPIVSSRHVQGAPAIRRAQCDGCAMPQQDLQAWRQAIGMHGLLTTATAHAPRPLLLSSTATAKRRHNHRDRRSAQLDHLLHRPLTTIAAVTNPNLKTQGKQSKQKKGTHLDHLLLPSQYSHV